MKRPELSQSAVTVAVYDFVEITLTLPEPPAVNPFSEIRVTGQFQRENSTPLLVDGFCDAADGSVFRIRFLPTEPGEYAYSVNFQSGGASADFSGTFTARDEGRRGLLRVSPIYPWHFQWTGTGEHCFLNGTTAYFLGGWAEPQLFQHMERLHGLGVNRLRVALNAARIADGRSWCEEIYPSDEFTFLLTPWECERPDAVGDPGYDVTRFRVAWWQKFERLLNYARQRDIIVSVLFNVDGQKPGADPFGPEGAGGEDEKRYYRYAAARLSAFSNVSWDITNEYHLYRDDAWVETMGTFLSQCDPYGHLMSVHGPGEFHFRTSPWADFASYQSWDETGGYPFMLRNRQMQADTGRPMPQINEEYGYEDHYPVPWGMGRVAPARDANSRRRLAWEVAMAGCYGTTGERANTGRGGWINGEGDGTMTMLRGYTLLRRFFEGFDWWMLEPRPDLVTGKALCLAAELRQSAELRQYVVYLPYGETAAVRLSPGEYEVSRFNPRTGEHETLGKAFGPDWVIPALPDREDWVLWVEWRSSGL